MTNLQTILHATCVSVGGHGVLILGVPGAGKSDLALRLIDQPGYGLQAKITRSELVADDQVVITRHKERLVATAPPLLKGKLEIRGLGIVGVKPRAKVALALVARLGPRASIARMPDTAMFEILGISLPVVDIDATAPSAAARLRSAVNWLVKHS
jgi:HPr kinase/phosphorylase